MKIKQKDLKELVKLGFAEDITKATTTEIEKIEKNENGFNKLGFSSNSFGCSGLLLQGKKSNKLYAITDRATTLFMF